MRRALFLLGTLVALVVLMAPAGAFALTTAGQSITNKATATYSVGASSFSQDSNTVTFKVAELLDVSVTWQDSGNIPVAPGDTDKVTTLKVTNTGNGTESYGLGVVNGVAGNDFDTTIVGIFIDADGDNAYDPYVDANSNSVCDAGEGDCPYTGPVSLNPSGTAGDSATVFVVADIPTGPADTDTSSVELTATSQTGTGAAGTTFAGSGDTGVDAVVGSSGGTETQAATYEVTSVTVALNKTYTVLDQFGGDKPVPGATITFSIAVTVTGSGTATGLVIKDAIPTYTTYKTGTLKLDAGALTDGGGDDAGDYNITTPGSVTVDLGSVAGGAPAQTITFGVTIN